MEGNLVGRYKLLKRLAAGGMGEVHLAAQGGPAGFERVVALKRILPTMASQRELVKLFLDEARLVARLSHRNICQIFELGEDGDGYFVAMEYVQGTSVRGLIDALAAQGARLPPSMAVDIAAQVADALAYAFEAPGRDGQPLHIIHRDVTPHNVLLSVSGDVKLIDFGVAKSADQSHATQGGTIKGKLAYMSPEQSRGKPLDGRSDLFALGIVLYEMLSGKNPFWRPDILETVRSIQSEAAPPLASVDPALAPCDPVVARLLAKNPEERPADANEAFELLSALKPTLPRAPKRLGPFVSEHFSAEISAVIKSVSDSDAQRALRAAPAPRESSDPVAAPTVIDPGTDVAPTSPHEPAPDLGSQPTAYRQPVEPTSANAGAQKTALLPPEAKSGSPKALVAAGLAVALIAAGAAAFLLLPASPQPTPPGPIAMIPPAPPAPSVDEPPQKLPEPPPVAKPEPEPAPPPPAVQPEPEPPPKPVDLARPLKKPKKDPKPVAQAPVVQVEPARPVEPPPPPPPPAPASAGTLSVSGGIGRNKVDLPGASGHVTLGRTAELVIGIDYKVAGGQVAATLTSEPFAILSIDGVSKGRTPIALPPIGKAPLALELRRLGGEPVRFVVSADLAK